MLAGEQLATFEKYESLLYLALAQVDAIEARDQKQLEDIMARKWNLIRSISGTKELLKLEPSLGEVIKKIQDADKIAEIKLAARMGDVQNKLCQFKKKSAAKQAYSHVGRKHHPVLGLDIDDTTPRFFDIHS